MEMSMWFLKIYLLFHNFIKPPPAFMSFVCGPLHLIRLTTMSVGWSCLFKQRQLTSGRTTEDCDFFPTLPLLPVSNINFSGVVDLLNPYPIHNWKVDGPSLVQVLFRQPQVTDKAAMLCPGDIDSQHSSPSSHSHILPSSSSAMFPEPPYYLIICVCHTLMTQSK